MTRIAIPARKRAMADVFMASRGIRKPMRPRRRPINTIGKLRSILQPLLSIQPVRQNAEAAGK
jgi:hypothetical protein